MKKFLALFMVLLIMFSNIACAEPEIQSSYDCQSCRDRGWRYCSCGSYKCYKCEGTGNEMELCYNCGGDGIMGTQMCRTCYGRGYDSYGLRCATCHASGYVTVKCGTWNCEDGMIVHEFLDCEQCSGEGIRVSDPSLIENEKCKLCGWRWWSSGGIAIIDCPDCDK